MKFCFPFFLLCFLLIGVASVSGDQVEPWADSLIARLPQMEEDTGKLAVLYQLVENIPDDDVWPAYNDQMGQLASKLMQSRDPLIRKAAGKYRGASLNNQAMLLFYHSDVQNSIRLYHESLKLREEAGDKKGIVESLNNLGYALHQQGQSQEALANFHRCLALKEK
jgi:tetratricopeptide (TPR) repeat protein